MADDSSTVPAVLRHVDEGVLVLTFNRPEQGNAWNTAIEEAYVAALVDAAADPDVRAIVMTGAGRTFCPGYDMEELAAVARGEVLAPTRRVPITLPMSIPKPILAAINGPCAGVGFILACVADIRFAARGAKLTTAFARRGLPAENGISWLLPRLVGAGAAMDLLVSGRVLLAEECQELGLINQVCEPDRLVTEAVGYARVLAQSCSPQAMATIKGQVIDDWGLTLTDSRERAVRLAAELREGADFREGVQSFNEKRPPTFAGLSAVIDIEEREAEAR